MTEPLVPEPQPAAGGPQTPGPAAASVSPASPPLCPLGPVSTETGCCLRRGSRPRSWQQTAEQLDSAATVWTSQKQRSVKAEPPNLAGAATALRNASSLLERVPAGDRVACYQAATDSAGVLAAAAAATPDDRVRRELVSAWKAIHRAVPVTVAASSPVGESAGQLPPEPQAPVEPSTAPHAVTWPRIPTGPGTGAGNKASNLLAGVSRVLMAARLADAPHHAQVQALLVQAVQLAAQISRTIAARQDVTEAQRRASAATAHAAALTVASARPGGWQFTKSGARVLEAARSIGTAETTDASPVSAVPAKPVYAEPPEAGR